MNPFFETADVRGTSMSLAECNDFPYSMNALTKSRQTLINGCYLTDSWSEDPKEALGQRAERILALMRSGKQKAAQETKFDKPFAPASQPKRLNKSFDSIRAKLDNSFYTENFETGGLPSYQVPVTLSFGRGIAQQLTGEWEIQLDGNTQGSQPNPVDSQDSDSKDETSFFTNLPVVPTAGSQRIPMAKAMYHTAAYKSLPAEKDKETTPAFKCLKVDTQRLMQMLHTTREQRVRRLSARAAQLCDEREARGNEYANLTLVESLQRLWIRFETYFWDFERCSSAFLSRSRNSR